MKKYLYLLAIITSLFVHSASAKLIGIDTVDGVNSLYTTDWGHAYNTGNDNEYNAIGRGNPAKAFEVDSTPYSFSSGDRLRISAWGCTIDDGSSCTGPDYLGGNFRALPVYSLIGVWSSSMTLISPIDLISGVNPAFLIGDLLDIVVPDFTSPLYLFMATNDGGFDDNISNNDIISAYTVQISQIPTPSVLWLMLFGLLYRKPFAKTRLQQKPA